MCAVVSTVATVPEAGGTRAGNRFPRNARLLKHSEFERVYHKGARQFAGNMTLFYLRRESGGPRVGLTVSRALGGAVERNRIKRRMREALRLCLPHLTAPLDVVINPRKAVLKVEFTALLGELQRALAALQQKSARG